MYIDEFCVFVSLSVIVFSVLNISESKGVFVLPTFEK